MLIVVFHPTASKEILRLPRHIRLEALGKIAELEKLDHPLQHRRVIQLGGRYTKDFRMRVGDYRIIFTLMKPHLVFVTDVHHRQVGY